MVGACLQSYHSEFEGNLGCIARPYILKRIKKKKNPR